MICVASHGEVSVPLKDSGPAVATVAVALNTVDGHKCDPDESPAVSWSTQNANLGRGDSSGSNLPALQTEGSAIAELAELHSWQENCTELGPGAACDQEALKQQPEANLEADRHILPTGCSLFDDMGKEDGVFEPLLQHMSDRDGDADQVELAMQLRSNKSSMVAASNVACASGNDAGRIPGCGVAVEAATTEWEAMLEGGIPAFVAAHRDIFLSRLRRGIPACCRWRAWKAFLGVEGPAEPGLLEQLLLQDSKWRPLILVDAPRTFPGTKVFDEEYQRVLVRILHAYSVLRPEVGYCQGMNFIAGLLLLVSQCQEEESFLVLRALMDERRLSGFFKEQFPLLRVYTHAFDQLMADVVPDLRVHLVSQSVEAEMFLQQWFLSLFINCLPLPAVLVIWDTVVYEGLPVLLKVALARLMTMRSLLLNSSFEDVMHLLRPKMGDQEQEEVAAQVGHLLLKQSDAITVPWRVQRQLLRDSLASGPLSVCLSIDCCGAGVRLLAYRHCSACRTGSHHSPKQACCSSGVWLLFRTWFAGGWLRRRRLMHHTD